jgi:hypothetical protein
VPSIPENRYGLDGKWDIGIGIWFEGVMIQRHSQLESLNYQRLTNIGLDYTFDIGNGLGLITEYFTLSNAGKPFASGQQISLTALSLNYPAGLLDNLTAMVYYDTEHKSWYRFFNWQRKYDNWTFYLIGYWNPDEYQLYQIQSNSMQNLYAGKGLQLMVVFNH